MKVPSSSLMASYTASVTAPQTIARLTVHPQAEAVKEIFPEFGPEYAAERFSVPKYQPKLAHPSLWKKRIEEDAADLCEALQRLVVFHPLVRAALKNQAGSTGLLPLFSVNDLTHDLYLLLLEKGRFKHYLQSQMSDAEIEREIYQIELTNLLIGRLRRRRPENYRIVRRVSGVLESEPEFKVFHKRPGQNGRYRRAAEIVYGLREWDGRKPMKDAGTFDSLIAHVPMRARNRRRVGCRGDAQVIVTNQELTELLTEILRALDSPASLRVLRQLALSKLPVYDAEISSLDEEMNEDRLGSRFAAALASAEASPEELALLSEDERLARHTANEFLDGLCELTKANAQRTERLWRVLWHCFFDPAEPSQLLIAELVGLSDSSVSDYRRKLEGQLRKLKLSLSQMRYFTEELSEQLRWRLCIAEPSGAGHFAGLPGLPYGYPPLERPGLQ